MSLTETEDIMKYWDLLKNNSERIRLQISLTDQGKRIERITVRSRCQTIKSVAKFYNRLSMMSLIRLSNEQHK